MIKFHADTPAGPLYGFGLSRGNIDKLTAGEPIAIDLRDMGGPNIHIAIMFGETERAMYNELKDCGLIPDGVEYRPAGPDEVIITRVKREPGEGKMT